MEGQQGMRRGADLTPSMMPIDSAARAGSGPEVFISLLHGDWDLPTGIHESPGYSSGQDYRYIGLTPGSVGKAAGGDPLFGSYGEYGGGAFGRHGDGLGGVSTRTADPSPFRVGDGIANALALLESDGPRGGGYTPGSRNMTDHGLVTTSPGMSVPRGGGADGPGYGFGGGPTTTGTRIAGIPRSDGIGGPNTGITPRATPGYTPDGPDGPDGPDRPTNPPPGGGGKPDGSGTVGEGHGSNDPGSRGVRGPVTVVGGAWGVNARLIYPPDARDQGIEGRVELSISVDITGQARNKAVVIRKSGHAILDRYAREQASQWYFYPKDGNRRDEVITVIVEFKLNG
jgi:TonB family protein